MTHDSWKLVDDYVKNHGGTWQIIRKLSSGKLIVTTAEPDKEYWIERNLHFHGRWDIIPSEEIIAYKSLPKLDIITDESIKDIR